MKYKPSVLAVLLTLATVHSALTETTEPPETTGLVVVNESVLVDSLTELELRNIYMGNTGNWKGGTKIRPCYLGREDDLRDKFFSELIGISFDNFKKHWLRLVFSGYGSAPVLQKTVKREVEYIRDSPGAIGIVPASWEGSLEGCRVIKIGNAKEF